MSVETEDTAMNGGEDSIPLDEGGETRLPIVEILTGRGFITGKSGSGKSNSASVVAEELLDRGFPLLIVDTDGEYYGLKEEYEMLHAGADEECDIQVGPEHAEKLATLALDEAVPIILDVSGYLDEDDASALVREVGHALFTKEKKLKQPFLMLVEEVHEYIPEKGSVDETGKMLVKIGKRGRKHGLGIAGISQRPADVKKDFITQANWMLWHRLTWENDTKVVRRVVDKETSSEVQDLEDGEAFLQADFLETDIQRVQVRRKRTFDAGATPDLEDFERPDLKSVSGDLLDELEDISQREDRRQDRIAELEARVEQLRGEKEGLQDELEQARDMTEMAEQFTETMTSVAGGEAGEKLQERVEEIREEKNQKIRDLRETKADLEEQLQSVREERRTLRERVEELEEYEQAVEHMDELREAVRRMNGALGIEGGADDSELRSKLQSAQDRIDDLEAENRRLRQEGGGADLEPLQDYEDFLNAEPVQTEIDAAKESDKTSPRYVKGVLAAIQGEQGPVPYEDIAERLGIGSTTHVSKAATELESRKIVTKESRDGATYVDLNVDGINEVREAAALREKTEELMEDL